ncbi:hypothetical protein V8F33_011902 [Rhypophila sp. PSN 637]
MEDNVTIKNRKDELAKLGLPHNSIKAILGNSYTAVKFIRLPTANDTSRLSSQLQGLYAMINSLTKDAQNNRRENNMLLSSDQMHHLYQLTFDHFSNSTTSPFDFMGAFLKVHPSPAELSGNIFELLQATFEAVKRGNQTSSHDSRRTAHSSCGPTDPEVADCSYENAVYKALQKFTDPTLPCGYTFPGSPGEEKVCVNGKQAHNPDRKTGSHQDGLWVHALVNGLARLNTAKLPELWDLHRKAIRSLHDLVPKVDLGRLPSCVWCMENLPTERLPCRHWICPSCVVGIGKRCKDDDRVFIVEHCDQHAGGGKKLNPPLEFLDLPKTVGRRLLSLNAGGLGGCFDLIGGTGVGGINALGMGISRLEVAEVIEKFKILVPGAFMQQDRQSFLFFSWAPKVPYSLDRLTRSIQETFGKGSKLLMAESLVTSSHKFLWMTSVNVNPSLTEPKPERGRYGQAVDVNGNQGGNLDQSQKKRKSHRYAEIYSIGEAAKATASFEPFFGPCTLNPGNDLHVGGAQDFACPAEATLLEAQSLWPQMLTHPPDVLVSIGCGHEASTTSGNSKDCTRTEDIWDKAFGERYRQGPDRYIRLCLKISNLPSPDDVSILKEDQERTLNQDDLCKKVDLVFRRLISTSFYFDKTSSKLINGGWIIKGFIQCRFKEKSRITKALGSKISSFSHPRFVCGEDVWLIDEHVLKRMTDQGQFRVELTFGVKSEDEIDMRFMADHFPSESISGSPAYQETGPRAHLREYGEELFQWGMVEHEKEVLRPKCPSGGGPSQPSAAAVESPDWLVDGDWS